MDRYYDTRLSAERLQRVYALSTPRVLQYLNAEIDHVLRKIRPSDAVLELGCGYGRVLLQLAGKADLVLGIDTSLPSIELGREILRGASNCILVQMDASELAFRNRSFDLVVCIQNGISAFHVDPRRLVSESIRVARNGARLMFSSYSDRFWPHRLEWFERQSEAGLLGEIDVGRTGNGVIVCRDGFTATTFRPADFASLAAGFDVDFRIEEVDGSSVFCEMTPL